MDSESFTPRAPSWFASGAMEPRGLGRPLDTAGSGPYCAPLMDSTQGLSNDINIITFMYFNRIIIFY
jgi:hypothetical protein